MNNIIARLEEIIENVPARDSRGNSDEEKEKYYNTLEDAEDAFLDVMEEIFPEDLWLEPGLLDEICGLAIKVDNRSYVDGEDKGYSHYQERLPFRIYDRLEFLTIPVPELLMVEIRKHLPNVRL
ncbi:MAG: hypothetical protein K6E85_12680 [Lachnospiraceae bacterium]|nr:hypothetical protein [Lachnospiraceae bacterium]